MEYTFTKNKNRNHQHFVYSDLVVEVYEGPSDDNTKKMFCKVVKNRFGPNQTVDIEIPNFHNMSEAFVALCDFQDDKDIEIQLIESKIREIFEYAKNIYVYKPTVYSKESIANISIRNEPYIIGEVDGSGS